MLYTIGLEIIVDSVPIVYCKLYPVTVTFLLRGTWNICLAVVLNLFEITKIKADRRKNFKKL